MRVGVAGLGRIGMMHARNLAQSEGVSEVVLLSRDSSRLKPAQVLLEEALAPDAPVEVAGEFAPRGRTADVRIGAGWDAEIEALDGVIISTITSTHPELTRSAARAGVPALVEKPLALDLGELERLADELDDLGTEVMVAFHRRYDPAHQELHRLIQAGEAGTVRAITATNHDRLPLSTAYIPVSGGIWLDMLIHDFDMIPWVSGQRVKSVWATGSVLDAPAHAEYGDVDSALAVLTLESGAVATVSGLRRNGAGQDSRLEVFGSLNSYGAGLEERTPMTSTEPDASAPAAPYQQFIERFERAFRAEISAFIDVAKGTGENLTPPREGLAAIRIALAADESRRTGETVDLF
ncbi:Gfo/Idh/MocA family protein [Microbacterium allomyrinae]|uniref:Gfo/Idh/MocA family oxidoreductase n=1 Tax=Microbacterium allomyrinae TaxID=2830666 RepID=A0A9X1LTK2_9MICO|nr:Gfo/Idh/MocA family oxidoreductase [Microbacterium allomyrinae]MCC2031547.1 Gfo/Idh/MocA family oxidoreductase [Microbacterium allomyrinae]